MFRTRALAKSAIAASRVQVNGIAAKPSRQVRTGDELVVERARERFEIEVVALSQSRGGAMQAQALYRESPDSVSRRTEAAANRRAERAGFSAPATRPGKRERRLILALGDIELM